MASCFLVFCWCFRYGDAGCSVGLRLFYSGFDEGIVVLHVSTILERCFAVL